MIDQKATVNKLVLLVVFLLLVSGGAIVYLFLMKKPAEEIITTKTPEAKSEAQIVEELRESTSSLKPEMVTERTMLDPADGSLVTVVDRKLKVKKDDKVWEFTAAEDAEVTRTTLSASAAGGEFPKTEKISLSALAAGDNILAILERDNEGKIISRHINVLLQAR